MGKLKDLLKNTFLKSLVYQINSTWLKDRGDNSYLYSSYSWDLPLNERLGKLLVRPEQSAKRIAYLMPKMAPDTPRYRAYNMAEVLNANSAAGYVASYFYESEIDALLQHATEIKLLILVRQNWTRKLQELISAIKNNGGEIAYDFDDLVFDIDKLPLLLEQIAAPAEAEGFYAYYVSTCYLAAKQADAFITPNGFLAEKISQFFNKPVHVVPNFLNAEQIARASLLAPKSAQESTAVTIGYFSGTKTHDKDFAMISSQLVQLLEAYPQLQLKLVGHLKLPQEFSKFGNRVIKKGLKNYLDLLAETAECDINIVPLPVNEFTNCKSELKYFEAALVKVPTVASPAFIFKQTIQDGETGLLAEPGQWGEQLAKLIENPTLREQLAEEAYKYCLEHYSGEEINKKVLAAVSGIVS